MGAEQQDEQPQQQRMKRKEEAVLNVMTEAEIEEANKAVEGMHALLSPFDESADELLHRIENHP